MDRAVIDNVPFAPSFEDILKCVRVKPDSAQAGQVRELAGEALRIARPKAVYQLSYIEAKGEDHVVIDGIRFDSRVLRVNLEKPHKVFVYVATCGMELEDWCNTKDDMLLRFWAGSINEMALGAAMRALDEDLDRRHSPGPTSRMNPGSLSDWPIGQQKPLFGLLGDVQGSIGVRLTDTFLMIPIKSVSGIRFPTDVRFENCQLCPREVCPGRRAKYDKDLYDKRYRKGTDSGSSPKV